MKIRNLRRYIFLNLCIIFTALSILIPYFAVLHKDEKILPFLPEYWQNWENFMINIFDFALIAYFLFIFEFLIRFIIMKFILKRKEKDYSAPKNILLRFFFGTYTFLLFIFAIFGYFINVIVWFLYS